LQREEEVFMVGLILFGCLKEVLPIKLNIRLKLIRNIKLERKKCKEIKILIKINFKKHLLNYWDLRNFLWKFKVNIFIS
jgi:hypothetical protein